VRASLHALQAGTGPPPKTARQLLALPVRPSAEELNAAAEYWYLEFMLDYPSDLNKTVSHEWVE